MPSFKLTQLAATAIDNGITLNVTTVIFGSGTNYTPNGTETSIKGVSLWTGPISNADVLGNNIVDYLCVLPEFGNTSTIQIGEAALLTDSGELFAIACFPYPFVKSPDMRFRLHALCEYANITSSVNLNLSWTMNLPRLHTFSELGDPQNVSSDNAIIINNGMADESGIIKPVMVTRYQTNSNNSMSWGMVNGSIYYNGTVTNSTTASFAITSTTNINGTNPPLIQADPSTIPFTFVTISSGTGKGQTRSIKWDDLNKVFVLSFGETFTTIPDSTSEVIIWCETTVFTRGLVYQGDVDLRSASYPSVADGASGIYWNVTAGTKFNNEYWSAGDMLVYSGSGTWNHISSGAYVTLAHDSEHLNGHSTGTYTNDIPLNDGKLNVTLNADMVDGKHWSDIQAYIAANSIKGDKGDTGEKGENGTRVAELVLYIWGTSTVPELPAGNVTYTWATGIFTLPLDSNGWSVIPHPSSTNNNVLWACKTIYSDVSTDQTSTITWSKQTPYIISINAPQIINTAICYTRSDHDTVPLPTGGSFTDPNPDTNIYGWSSKIPSGDFPLFTSTRIFTSDGLSPQGLEWGTPTILVRNGLQGPNGNEVRLYTWIKYSNTIDGANMTTLPTSSTQYIGMAINKYSETPSDVTTDYTWSRWRGDTGISGSRTAVIDMYINGTVAPTVFPQGQSIFTWDTASFTAPQAPNGWSIEPPTLQAGETLYVARTVYADTESSLTSSITWKCTLAIIIGAHGANGSRVAMPEVYKWSASTPTLFPSGTSTYTWATAHFTDPTVKNGWNIEPGASTPGYNLYGCSVTYVDQLTTLTTDITWNTSSAYIIGTAGSTGPTGPTVYTYFAYADDDKGTHFSLTPLAGSAYFGTFRSTASAVHVDQPTDWLLYTWVKTQGISGPAGGLQEQDLATYLSTHAIDTTTFGDSSVFTGTIGANTIIGGTGVLNNLVVQEANIKEANVTTLKIGGHAVTVPVIGNQILQSISITNTIATICSASITVAYPCTVIIHGYTFCSSPSDFTDNVSTDGAVYLYKDQSQILANSLSTVVTSVAGGGAIGGGGFITSVPAVAVVKLSDKISILHEEYLSQAGTYVFSLKAGTGFSGATANDGVIVLLGVMR